MPLINQWEEPWPFVSFKYGYSHSHEKEPALTY